MTKISEITECSECGSKSLTWGTHYKTNSGVPEGRLRSSEVQCLFVLGCDECSETLAIVSVDKVAAALSAQKSDPWAPSGADYDSAIHRNPDAKAWADFFVSTFPGQADKHGLMIGWFANAMMAMHDYLKAQQSAHVCVPREWLDAVKELFDAKQAKEDFERENPGNSTKRWDACLYRIEAAEDALRALLNGGEA